MSQCDLEINDIGTLSSVSSDSNGEPSSTY